MIALRSLREERGYSQKEIASALNVATSTYNQWETGKREPDYETLRRIADYFHVTTDYLLGRESPVSAENGQKEKAVDKDGPEANGGLNMDALTPDERAILDLLRQVPDEDLPAAHRAIKALLAGMRDGE